MTTLSEVLLQIDSDLLEEDNYFRQVRGDDVVLLAHLHCLTSTVALFERLIKVDVGLSAKRITLIAKPYSTINGAIESLKHLGITVIEGKEAFRHGYYDDAASQTLKSGCEAALKACQSVRNRGRTPRLVIVDDGGMVTETWWRHHHNAKLDVVSIQQTTSGTRRKPVPSVIPKIDVSRSAAKRRFEAKIISSGVLKKVRELHLLQGVKTVGVVGIGALGRALAKDLETQGMKVLLYDVKRHQDMLAMGRPGHLPTLMACSEVIFGCTGRNFLWLDQLRWLNKDRPTYFVSCSSRDVEFMNLLRLAHEQRGSFDRVCVKHDGRICYLENGGFPINFDRRKEQETADDIALTRGLVLAGILQALCVDTRRTYTEPLQLSPQIQRKLVDVWMGLTGARPDDFGVTREEFDDIRWWNENSFGTSYERKGKPRDELTPHEMGRRSAASSHPRLTP